jgi:hypothetical protein
MFDPEVTQQLLKFGKRDALRSMVWGEGEFVNIVNMFGEIPLGEDDIGFAEFIQNSTNF